MEFKKYRRKQIAELRNVNDSDLLQFVRKKKIVVLTSMGIEAVVNISAVDLVNGSPKEGDMIARDSNNHLDQWLVSKKTFEDNFEEI